MGAIEKVGLLAGFSLFSVLLHAREGRADGSTIFPMEEAGGHPAGPEQPWGAGGRQGRGDQYGTIFPMGAAGSHPADPEQPWELGGHQESEDRQEILISPTLIMAPNIDKGHKARG